MGRIGDAANGDAQTALAVLTYKALSSPSHPAAAGAIDNVSRRSADPDGGNRRFDSIILAVRLADRPRDKAHAAFEKPKETTLAAIFAARVVVIINAILRAGRECGEATVGKTDLRTSAPGFDCIA